MKDINLKLIAFTALILCCATGVTQAANKPLPSNTPAIVAHGEANKGLVTVGEPIEYKVMVRYKKEIEILSGIDQPESVGLEVKDVKDWEDQEGQFRIVGKTFNLIGYQLGNFLISPIEITYRTKGGGTQTVKTNPAYISVKSIAEGEEKNDIRDVKGVVKLPYQILKYLLWIGIPFILFVLLAIYLAFFRNKVDTSDRAIEKLSPADQALRDLHELFESTWIRDGKIKIYYLRFSEILKLFLEKQFGVQATEATTSDIIRLMKRIPVADESKKHLIDALEAADFAKFAKWVPTATNILALNKQAEAIVIELSTQPTPVIKAGQNAVS